MQIVSVIIPVFNRDKFIINTLNTLKEQNYRPIEVILIDDASTDNTVNEIKTFIKNNSEKEFNIFLYLNKSNKGACFCRNYGLHNSNGEYIQFLDSDDLLHVDKIDIQVKALEKNNSNVVISDYQYLKNNKVIKKCRNNGNLFKRMALGWSMFTASPLIRSCLIKNKITWNEKLLFLQDKDFLFKVLMLSGHYSYIPNFSSYYIQHGSNQISDLYSIKRPQFFRMIISRFSFLFSNFLTMKFKCIVYTILGILEIFFQFVLYYIKKSIKTFFGEKIFNKIKKYFK